VKAPLAHVSQLVFNTPLAIMPEKLEAILKAIGPRLIVDSGAALEELLRLHAIPAQPLLINDAVVITGQAQEGDESNKKPYRLTPEGIAVIPMNGTLLKKNSWMSASSGLCSYQGLQQAATAALADPMVKAVLWDVDSPGGTTHGCFELSQMLYDLRGEKPIWACANDLAASAAYCLASAADRLFVTATGGVGSVGVFALHCDMSSADEQTGLKFTYIFAGGKKTDGNPHEPLSKSAKADIQAEVDREYAMFVQAVARNRGFAGADQENIQKTQAAVKYGDGAVGILADEVATLDEALEALCAKVNGSKLKGSGKVALGTNAVHNVPNGTVAAAPGTVAVMPAIPPHKTATSDGPWDGPKAKKNLRQDADAAYYRSAYAFAKPGGDPKTKAGYSFIHHEVSSGGDVGAANIKACQTSIGVLNGGRGGTVLKGGDRKGVYNHVAKHLRDAKLEPAPLAEYRDYLTAMLEYALEVGDARLHSETLVYLVTGTDDPAEEGEDAMAARRGQEEEMRRSKKSEAEDVDAADEKDDEKDDDQDDDDGEEDDDKKPPSDAKRGKKPASKKSKKDTSDDEDDDDGEDDKKGRRGEVTEMPLAANSAAKRIAELCQIAGAPELAADFIVKGYNVEKVIAKLSERRSKASTESGAVNSFVTGDVPAGTGGSQASIDEAIRQAHVMAANSGGALTRSKAFEQLLRMNPAIYDRYMEERDAVIAQSPSGSGRVLREYVLNNQRRYMAGLGLSGTIDDVPARRSMV
jgi:signal peptide peptidase SppA